MAGFAVGGFLIDMDHAVDYVTVERRREITPADIVFNGRLTPKNIFAFYSFGFRLAHGFDAEALFGAEPLIVPVDFWRSFFFGARLAHPRVGRRAAAPSPPAVARTSLDPAPSGPPRR